MNSFLVALVVVAVADASDLFTFTGDCDVEADCISSKNYPDVYGNSETCSITMSQNVSVIVRSTFLLEKCCDNLIIRKLNVQSKIDVPKILKKDETLFWKTDLSVTKEGWQFCFFASDYFMMTGDCDVAGDCVSSNNYPESHGHNEKCTVTMSLDASVTVGTPFSLEKCCDHLMIRDNEVEFRDEVPLTLYSGETFSWSSDSSVSFKGWEMCFSSIGEELISDSSVANDAIVEKKLSTNGFTVTLANKDIVWVSTASYNINYVVAQAFDGRKTANWAYAYHTTCGGNKLITPFELEYTFHSGKHLVSSVTIWQAPATNRGVGRIDVKYLNDGVWTPVSNQNPAGFASLTAAEKLVITFDAAITYSIKLDFYSHESALKDCNGVTEIEIHGYSYEASVPLP